MAGMERDPRVCSSTREGRRQEPPVISIRNPWGEGFFFGYGRAYDEVETKEGTVFRPKKTGSAESWLHLEDFCDTCKELYIADGEKTFQPASGQHVQKQRFSDIGPSGCPNHRTRGWVCAVPAIFLNAAVLAALTCLSSRGLKTRLVLPLLILGAVAAVQAQQTATAQISGVVQDPSGAAIPGAEVRVTQTETALPGPCQRRRWQLHHS